MLKEQVSHYRILRKLGAGGMGEVYLAEDARLFRQVALKFLPASYQYDPERRARFLKEARAASALRTPNAAAIYDIGEHEGLSFIAMEYVEGELLSSKIRRGVIAAQEALDITIQLAEALEEAHSLGIIHRDIKSNNIIITPRRLVKLLDFGLAQIANQAGGEDLRYLTTPLEGDINPTTTLGDNRESPAVPAALASPADSSVTSPVTPPATEEANLATRLLEEHICDSEQTPTVILNEAGSLPAAGWQQAATAVEPHQPEPASASSYSSSQATTVGRLMGTVPYMSPEQALGKPLDARTDLFSLGVVMYEMLTGKMPFAADSEAQLIEQIVGQEPPPITQLNPAAPPPLAAVAEKCLAKERQRRFLSAQQLLADLRALRRDSGELAANASQPLRRARAKKAVDSLAILPFENTGGNSDGEYLSDGITESIINQLSQLAKLKVMARSTVFRYKGRAVDAQTVGSELGVRAVLTGRVMQRGDTLVIKTELVDTGDGSQIWGEQFNRKIFDIFAVEEEISREISEKLKLKLTGEQKRRLGKRHTENTLAYQEYLKGRYVWNKRTREGLTQSLAHFNRAIDIDPNYALAYAGLADTYNIIASYSSSPPAEAFPKARSAATRALAIDNTLAEAHTSLAFVRFGYDWDWQGAEREYRLALELKHGYADAHQWYALFLAALGRQREAHAEMAQALELDPLSLAINTNQGWLFYLGRDFDLAISQLRRTLDIEPNFLLARRRLAQAYAQAGKLAQAEAEFDTALQLSGEDTETLASRGYLYALAGKPEHAAQSLEELNAISYHRYVPAYFFAKIFMGLGERDRAFKFLEMAFEERYGFLAYMKVEPELDGLREDGRFGELARRVGLD